MSVPTASPNSYSSKVNERACQITAPRMCVRASIDIAEHAELSLSGCDSSEVLDEAKAIIHLARRWLAGRIGYAKAVEQMLAHALAENSAIDSDVWNYYLATCCLAWMISEVRERSDQPERLAQIAQKTRSAVTSAADKGPGYGSCWAAEGDWQVKYLERLLGLCADLCVGDRLRNSLLAS